VTLVARDADRLAETAGSLGAGASVRTLSLDVADERAVSELLDRELSARPADLLVTCAGVSHAGRLVDTDPSVFRRITDVNLLGTVWTTRTAVPHLAGRPGAHIATVASMAAVEGVYGYSAYGPSKAAVLSFAQVLRAELRPLAIGVSVLLAPNTDTAMLRRELEQLPPEMRPIHATSAVMRPDRVADSLVAGIAGGRFEIIPGALDRPLVRLHRVWPGPVRATFDALVRREIRRTSGARDGSPSDPRAEPPALADGPTGRS
jgi:3-dehydrosphinganine reductase